MAPLKRFDVATYGGVAFVVIESDLLPADDAIVTIPLFTDYPAIKHLNPTIDVAGHRFVLATRLIAAVRRSELTRIGSVEDQGDRITRAVDMLMSGI